jgi:iron(III) transport system permease protein
MSSAFASLSKKPRQFLVLGATFCAVLAALPLTALIILGFGAGTSQRLFNSLLPTYLSDTILLLAGAGILTFLIGVTLGWLLTNYDFPGRSTLQWLVLLPLALPGYVVSYVYVELLNYAGPIQTSLRAFAGWTRPGDYMFPEIRSVGGAALVLSFVLYPYVYLAARNAFLKQSQNQVHAARALGQTAFGAFLRIALPMAMPTIAVGILLALLEALNDIGAAQFFGVKTITYGVYSLWLGEGNLAAATQLAVILCFAAMLFVLIEQFAHGFEHKYRLQTRTPSHITAQLTGWRAVIAIIVTLLPVLLGFVCPMIKLAGDAVRHADQFFTPGLWLALWHSVELALIVSAFTILFGLVIVYAQRHATSNLQRLMIWIGTFGYAIPGTVLAIGLLLPFGGFDKWINNVTDSTFGVTPGLILSGSLAGLSIALIIRFLTISFRTLENGARRVTPSLDAAARTLGKTAFGAFLNVHLPLLRPALIATAIMVFVDTMKELPATLLMRPFDFETLATRLFERASLASIEEAAAPAMIIVLAGLLPVFLLSRQIAGPDRRD